MILWVSPVVCVLALVSGSRPLGVSMAGQNGSVRTTGSVLLSVAIDRPTPHYPEESRRAGRSGVAVASVEVGVDGRMRRVEVLQSPDQAIAESLTTALLRWTFRGIAGPSGRNGGVRAKLTFYFVIQEGRGVVLTFEEMARLKRPTAVSPPLDSDHEFPAIAEAEWIVLASQARRPVLLDIRNRDEFQIHHRNGAVNIPLSELSERLPAELRQADQIVLDCSNALSNDCRIAARRLAQGGYASVTILYGK